MNRMPALGVNWNRMDPFVRYSPFDFPVIQTPYDFPVIQETPPVVVSTIPATTPAALPTWVIVGGALLAGGIVGALLLKD